MTRPSLATSLLVTTCAVLGACQSTPEQERAPAAAAPDPAAKEEPADPEAEAQKARKKELERANDLADRAHSLAQARIDLTLAELEVQTAQTKAERALAEATRELKEEELELAVFPEHERPQQLDDARLGLDRAAHRLELEQDELGELTAMYEQDDFAELTKELVLKRGRKGVEFAERSLTLERAKLQLLEGETLPKKERELRAAVDKARSAVEVAQAGLDQSQLEAQKKLSGARYAITKLERPRPEDVGGD
jgi:HlyD family secretion protein